MKKLFVYISFIVLLNSCYYDKEETLYGITCDTSAVTYNASIAPVIASNCLNCHSGAFASANLNLSNYTNVRVAALTGKLYAAISHLPGVVPMPYQGNKLSDCTIARFRIWINSGAPNN